MTSFPSYVRPNPSERTVMGYVHDALETGDRSVLIAINPEDRQAPYYNQRDDYDNYGANGFRKPFDSRSSLDNYNRDPYGKSRYTDLRYRPTRPSSGVNFYPGSNGVFSDIALQSMPLSQLYAICDWLDVLSAVFKEAGVKSQLQRINHIYSRILTFLPTRNSGTRP